MNCWVAEGTTVADLAADIAALKANSIPDAELPELPQSAVAAVTADSPRFVELSTQPPAVELLQLKVKAMETILSAHPYNDELNRRLAQLLADERLHVQVSGEEFSYGGALGRIQNVKLLDADGQSRTWFSSCEPVVVRMLIEADEPIPEPIFALTIKNVAGVEIYGTNTLFGKQPAPAVKAGSSREVDFSFNLNLMPGHYFISLGFTHFVGDELVVIHRRYDTIKFEIHGKDRAFGIANLQAKITSRNPSAVSNT